MRAIPQRVHFLVLLMTVAFLAAQFHACPDLSTAQAATHLCPLCSLVGSVVAPSPLQLSESPAIARLELVATFVSVSSDAALLASPRAPPAL